MNADAFRHLYGYHFSENRALWDNYVMPLSDEQFTQAAGYSRGSVRNQVVHIMSADNVWFGELRNADHIEDIDSIVFADREQIRARWDQVEHEMRDYLAELRDDMLLTRPIKEPDDDRNLVLWQVLIHVVNHGTDHRAQLLRQLNDMGVKTVSQDYIFYLYDHP